MPALGMAQETGKLVRWLKAEGETVHAGEPIMEIETDKVTVEIEAPASGTLANVTAKAGEDIPVGQAVGMILAPGELSAEVRPPAQSTRLPEAKSDRMHVPASPVAARIAAEHNLDLRSVRPDGGRVSKSDVLGYLRSKVEAAVPAGRIPASPKARRLASERDMALDMIQGTGPGGAVLADDVLTVEPALPADGEPAAAEPSSVWRLMAERVSQSWAQAPHFYLLREVDAGRFVTWRERAQKRTEARITFTDMLVRLVAVALKEHPRLNAQWRDGRVYLSERINIGLAVAIEDGLIVPVISEADRLDLDGIAARRQEVVERANAGRLRPEDLQGGTFTLSNLGMYGVDAFSAIINPPQAAILAVGRIADRVVPVAGQPEVRPMMMLSLSCDHRVVDGARGAQFLQTLVELIEEPIGLLR